MGYSYFVRVYPSWLGMGGLDYPPETHVRIERRASPEEVWEAWIDYSRTRTSNAAATKPLTGGMTTLQQAEDLCRRFEAVDPYRRGGIPPNKQNMDHELIAKDKWGQLVRVWGDESRNTSSSPRRSYTVSHKASADPS